MSRASKKKEQGKDFFLENGAWLLEELIVSCDGKCNPIRNFSVQEIMKATNNYDQDRILRKSEDFTLYRGTHEDHDITIKKFKGNYTRFTEKCINEIGMLSQINHRNVLKIMGYCIETEIPILVYEFAANGDLFDHIFKKEERRSSESPPLLSWERRLRIATETASAVSYIHTATSKPIIHRDIKAGNIMLDQRYVAKLSDFSFSISIPLGDTHVEDAVRGTIGFIAPEYLASGRFTEKADVYSFGMLLLELLTGKTPWSLAHLAEDLNVLLLDYVRSFVENNRLSEIVECAIWEEAETKQQLQAFAELAIRCTNEMAMERPTMMEVAQKLRWIDRSVQP